MSAPQQSASQGMVLSGSFNDSEKATKMLAAAAARWHLVSPATSCPHLPEGCSLALSTVIVDAKTEVYDVGGGKVGLSKTALEKIAGALGVSWDPHATRRLDDRSDPRYCLFVAVGRVRGFDGVEMVCQGTKEMDLRDGSPQIEALISKAKAKNRDPMPQIREMRLHILGHAESKARLRAIRSLGVRSSYFPQELAKPFVVAKLMFTGETDDPELRRAFALKRADAFLQGHAALYGSAPAPALPPAPRRPPPALPPPERSPEPQAPPVQSVDAPSDVGDDFAVPVGAERGTPIAKASDRALAETLDVVEEWIRDGEVRDVDKARRFVEVVRAELDGRGKRGGDAR